MRQIIGALALLLTLMTAAVAQADQAWVQIEARPTLDEARQRAEAYGGAFGNVQGYRLRSGWYGIVLGPFTGDEAARQLGLLKGERMIPADSFLTRRGDLGTQFWPDAGSATADPLADPLAPAAPAADPLADTPEVAAPAPADESPDESPDEARISEGALSPDDRADIQRAMQFFGAYRGQLDGSFGKGTRAAMADWQKSRGYQPTGILTTAERRDLLESWQKERDSLGLQSVTEGEAGIMLDLPTGLVEFKGYEPPFVRYDAKDGSGYQLLLISRQGDSRALTALADRIEGLAIMPIGAERDLKKNSLRISGESDTVGAWAQADLSGGLIKGFVLVWPKAEADRAGRVLDAMKATFMPLGDKALDEDMGEPSAVTGQDLLSGLEERKPALSRTGFFVSTDGAVLTTADVVEGCARITVDGRYDASVVTTDKAIGLALLKPAQPLAPRGVARLETTLPRQGSDVAFAGFSYGDALSAPVVTFGTFADAKGLNGEPDLIRLQANALPGDTGAAVLDSSGALVGMLLPRPASADRTLPKDVLFAANGQALARALAPHAVDISPADVTGALAAEDLAARARDMTTLVSCWK